MNKKILVFLLVVVLGVIVTFAVITVSKDTAKPAPNKVLNNSSPNNSVGIANPASVYCEQQGGKLSIITDTQGGQTGICIFANGVKCDEWKFFRGECSKDASSSAPAVDIETDTELIKLALVEKDGINLNLMNVVVKKDTGTYASGSINPKEPGPGGAYFFAAKTASGWKIVASGNGIISCDSLELYPKFPANMISECVDPVSGNLLMRD